MMNKRYFLLGLVLLLLIPALLLNSGCDIIRWLPLGSWHEENNSELPTVPLGEALQGEYAILVCRSVSDTETSYELVADIELSDGRYTITPCRTLEKLLSENQISFFGENPTGTYTLQYADGINDNKMLADLDEYIEISLGWIKFHSSTSAASTLRKITYNDISKTLALDIFWSTSCADKILKPWPK